MKFLNIFNKKLCVSLLFILLLSILFLNTAKKLLENYNVKQQAQLSLYKKKRLELLLNQTHDIAALGFSFTMSGQKYLLLNKLLTQEAIVAIYLFDHLGINTASVFNTNSEQIELSADYSVFVKPIYLNNKNIGFVEVYVDEQKLFTDLKLHNGVDLALVKKVLLLLFSLGIFCAWFCVCLSDVFCRNSNKNDDENKGKSSKNKQTRTTHSDTKRVLKDRCN